MKDTVIYEFSHTVTLQSHCHFHRIALASHSLKYNTEVNPSRHFCLTFRLDEIPAARMNMNPIVKKCKSRSWAS